MSTTAEAPAEGEASRRSHSGRASRPPSSAFAGQGQVAAGIRRWTDAPFDGRRKSRWSA
jgi:hypothetical protein